MKKYALAFMSLIWCNTQCEAALQQPSAHKSSTWIGKFTTIFQAQEPSEDQLFVMGQIKDKLALIVPFLDDLDTTHRVSEEDKLTLIKHLENLISRLVGLTDEEDSSLACAFVAGSLLEGAQIFIVDIKNTLYPVQQRRKSRAEKKEDPAKDGICWERL
jgi:hypothetical protein